MSRIRFHPAFAFTLLAGLVSCQGSGSPMGGDARIEVVAGDAQRGLAGERLPEPIEVRVVDEGNRPLPGRRVDFVVAAGGGSVAPATTTTDADGRARAEWRLGRLEVRTQRVTVTTPDGSGAAVAATALGAGETDVIVIRGAAGPMKGVLLVRDDGPGSPLTIVQQRATADTLVPIQPMAGGTTGVVVFPWANALEWKTVTWTAGIDTVRVDLRPPVALALQITVAEGPFDVRTRVVEEHLSAFRGILESEGAGITLADVRIVDRTATMGGIDIEGGDQCSFSSVPEDRLHAYYVRAVGGHSPRGVACPPRLAFVAAGPGESPNLLAHEVGHLLGLPHVGQGMMSSSAPGATLTDGLIFQAHFHEFSAVNAVFGWNPPERRRRCGTPQQPTCLPLDYEMP